jgi:hypothetical protein
MKKARYTESQIFKILKCRFSIGCSSEIGENEGSQSLSITPGDPG